MSQIRRYALLALVALSWTAGGCSREVKVGALISEHGGVGPYGQSVRKGLDLAADELNAAGGHYTLIYKDPQTRAELGRQQVYELIEQEDVPVIIGAISSKVTLAVAPICEEEEVVLLSPSASAPSITDAGYYIFRNYPSDILEGTSMAEFARDLGLERVVIFSLDNVFGEGLERVFTAKYESKYRKVVKTFRLTEDGTNDFNAMVVEAKQLDPDGVYIIAYLADLAALLSEMHAANLQTVLLGTSSVVPLDVVRLAGADASQLLVYPRPAFDPESDHPNVRTFVDAYRTKYGETPDLFAAHGYDALKLVDHAISVGGRAAADVIKGGLEGLQNYEGAAGRTTFDENGDVVRYPRLFIIADGEALPFDRFKDEGGSLFDHRRS